MAPLLEVCGLSVHYGGVRAVEDVALDVPVGAIVGLIGPNGAGKTTTIDALTGFVATAGGEIVFDGRRIDGLQPHERARLGVARTFQSMQLFDGLTVEGNLLVAAERGTRFSFVRDLMGRGRVEGREDVAWALDAVGLSGYGERQFSELPHGQQKLVAVARALASRPKLVLLDEPAAGLDTNESLALRDELRKVSDQGVTVLLVDHDMGLVLSLCDYVYVLNFGQVLAAGTPAEIRVDGAVIEAYLGHSTASPQEVGA